jgi:hypothetical protein
MLLTAGQRLNRSLTSLSQVTAHAAGHGLRRQVTAGHGRSLAMTRHTAHATVAAGRCRSRRTLHTAGHWRQSASDQIGPSAARFGPAAAEPCRDPPPQPPPQPQQTPRPPRPRGLWAGPARTAPVNFGHASIPVRLSHCAASAPPPRRWGRTGTATAASHWSRRIGPHAAVSHRRQRRIGPAAAVAPCRIR